MTEGHSKVGHSRQTKKDRGRVYLRKRAASEEAEQSESLSRDSYTHLRRRDKAGKDSRQEFWKEKGKWANKKDNVKQELTCRHHRM